MTSASENIPEDLRYSTEHEWIKAEGEGLARVGITAYAQDELGDIMYVSPPNVGTQVGFMEKFGEVESVKVASELFSPASGEVVEVNRALDDSPELINIDPYGRGWMLVIRLSDESELDRLLDASGYRDLVRREQGG
jgi:glycine cleavage system H protein